ncbi:MAG TPA: hypothetical protein ENH41_00965 [Candidatus Omnitrophica bacterium]|nr:hypothetical protein [Candidatus Omnitrophota bacterium]
MQNKHIASHYLIVIICLVMAGCFFGCASEYNLATGKEEVLLYSTEKEIKLGRSIARQIEKEYKVLNDPSVRRRVEQIGEKVAAVSDRKDIIYYFQVLDKEEPNAVSLPGGYIYLNKGLVDIATDDEIACVLAHEIVHVVARHSMKKLQASMGYMLVRILAAQTGSPGVGYGADAAFGQIMLGYSRQDELLADRVGVGYAKEAGFKPEAMLTFLEKLKEDRRKKPITAFSYNRTHPFTADRIKTVKQAIGQSISFTDYINTQEEIK